MIKEISVSVYRKLKDIKLQFSPCVNIISGVNGTCKSSLLHIISNSFQALKQKCDTVSDPACVRVISKVNSLVNPKIEALTRGDKKYRDPAIGHKGTLYSISYASGLTLDFRKHNSEGGNRYAVKPKYTKGTQDRLPILPVIYLGLPRLFPFGEIADGQKVNDIKAQLPPSYIDELKALYKDLMFIEIQETKYQDVNGFKKRGDFVTTKDGVDSNTISSGEDNVFVILLALVSLRYYYDSLKTKSGNSESILLVDEFDATLHPSLQWRLMRKIRDYSRQYAIQVVSTTHSLSLIEDCLRCKDNVIYLTDNNGLIGLLPEPDKYKIEAKLKTLSMTEIYADRKIPVLTEDAEACCYLKEIFDYYQEQYDGEFANVRSCFELVDATFGAETLKKLFKNHVVSGAMRGICVLDGDKPFANDAEMLACSSVLLPGGDSPEKVIFRYAEDLFNNPGDSFWTDASVESESFDCNYYQTNIRPGYEKIQNYQPGTDKRQLRDLAKAHFNSFFKFYLMVIRRMLRDENMQEAVKKFMRNFNILFKKNADFHRISPSRWTFKDTEASNVS